MNELTFASLGETWVNLVNRTLAAGIRMGEEGFELVAVEAGFPATINGDPLLERFGDKRMIIEMEKVFFTGEPNTLAHSYAHLMRGPAGRSDLQDILALLRSQPLTKRAVVTFTPAGDARVPCLNVIQFLLRNGALQTIYFARGQDVFRKFYADGLCVARMARTVADGLGVPAGTITAFIGSSHIYDSDLPAIRALLAEAKSSLRGSAGNGGQQ